MVKPIIPIIEYYANYDYIAAELCENRDKPYLECNGKCYLQKQIKENNKTSNHDHNAPIPAIDLSDYPVSPIEPYLYSFNSEMLLQNEIKHSNKYFTNKYISKLLIPPQVIS